MLEGAIARLTAALVTAADEAIPELVAERRAMREELAAVRERATRGPACREDDGGQVVELADERARRAPR